MNLAHLHLLLNHFPIIGTIIGLGLLAASLIGKNDDLKRDGLMVLAAVALLALKDSMGDSFPLFVVSHSIVTVWEPLVDRLPNVNR